MKTKICSGICGLEKPLFEFSKAKKGKFGVRRDCKDCKNKKTKEWHIKNKEENSLKYKLWYTNNKEKRKKYQKLYRDENKKSLKQSRKNNQVKLKLYAKKYSIENRQKINKYKVEQRKNNINIKIKQNLRSYISKFLNGRLKSKKTLDLLGCSIEELKIHLESQFTSGMSWDNYGLHGWHVDHIKPCASFDLSKPIEQRKCFNFNNLQPLWAIDNLRKGSKIKKEIL